MAPASLVADLVEISFAFSGSIIGLIASSIPGSIAGPISDMFLSSCPVLLFMIDDITGPFFLKNPITANDNSNVYIYMKKTI